MRNTRNLLIVLIILTAGAITATSMKTSTKVPEEEMVGQSPFHSAPEAPPAAKKILLALLLDTSNSMDGLIDQAKAQLWNIVDELADAKYQGQPAELTIALYEYGNDNLSIRSNYIRQVVPFTNDLDTISASLFALTTNGGSEYCGAVIRQSLSDLDWGAGNDEDLKMVFIAGNEPFDQGPVGYQGACQLAANRSVIINTIFCGNYEEGKQTHWFHGAQLGAGNYLNIDMDQQTVHVSTPYDAQVDKLNDKLNDTYIPFGVGGAQKKARQLQQDNNAEQYSRANKVKRAISKSKGVYRNDEWDLVDAAANQSVDIARIEADELPVEMQSMSTQEKRAYVFTKGKERKDIQKEIQQLGDKRRAYIKQYNDSLAIVNPLEEAILQSVKGAAVERNFEFPEGAPNN